MKDTFYLKLEAINRKYHELSKRLEDSTITEDLEQFKAITKEHAQLKPVCEGFQHYKQLEKQLKENAFLLNDLDPEVQILAAEENTMLKETIFNVTQQLQIMLLPKDPDDNRNVFLEIRAAAGGAEASLFAGNLLRMYLKYAERQSWSTEIISANESEQGGYKEVILNIGGSAVYSQLKFESGTHRIQRVPETEAQGRIHTSTCTVAILPVADKVDKIEINPNELRIDTFRASGAGGQHVQKTDSAVRITHLPTQTVVVCQDQRSQIKNREQAMQLLYAKLLSESRAKSQQKTAATRRSLVGKGDRSERIRTYNIPQGRLTDHRIPLTLHQLSAILEGELSLIIEPLKNHSRIKQLQAAEE
jgi:peptide chain release factor 1